MPTFSVRLSVEYTTEVEVEADTAEDAEVEAESQVSAPEVVQSSTGLEWERVEKPRADDVEEEDA